MHDDIGAARHSGTAAPLSSSRASLPRQQQPSSSALHRCTGASSSHAARVHQVSPCMCRRAGSQRRHPFCDIYEEVRELSHGCKEHLRMCLHRHILRDDAASLFCRHLQKNIMEHHRPLRAHTLDRLLAPGSPRSGRRHRTSGSPGTPHPAEPLSLPSCALLPCICTLALYM